jgi:hypothetical protein
MHMRMLLASFVGLTLGTAGCAAQKCSTTINPDSVTFYRSKPGPYAVSRPLHGETEYIITIRPELDQYTVAHVISCRVHGKIGYINGNFKTFSLYAIRESDVDRIKKMPEVVSVEKSVGHPLDNVSEPSKWQ